MIELDVEEDRDVRSDYANVRDEFRIAEDEEIASRYKTHVAKKATVREGQ